MMGKLQAAAIASSDAKEVIITSDASHCESPEIRVVRINTHGASPTVFEADKAIVSSKKDNDKRRTVKLERAKSSSSWGFTLQSYGIYNATLKSTENYTYVDYVEVKSPAFTSGMRRGDIIFAVDGQSTEDLTHSGLIAKISTCKNNMRLVLVNANICEKVELYQRRQKLQALLRQKQSELKGLEKREAAISYSVTCRVKEKERRRLRARAASCSQLSEPKPQETTFITENNNIKTHSKSPRLSPGVSTGVGEQRDVRPKLNVYMSKLALSDEPTAYERILLSESKRPKPSGSSTMSRTLGRVKSPNSDIGSVRSLRSVTGTSISDSKLIGASSSTDSKVP